MVRGDVSAPRRAEGAVRPRSASLADAAGISVLVTALMLFSYLRARHTIFWSDEIMGWLVLRQSSLHQLLQVWRAGIDSSGIFFYLLARPWIGIFGASALALRLFSAAGVALSAAILWLAARRVYAPLPVAAAVSFVYAATLGLRWQLANGRTYGVFLTAAVCVLYLLVWGEDPKLRRPTPGFLLYTALAYSLLMGSHILGVLYVGAFLGMQVLLDLSAKRFRPQVYAAALVSVSVLLFSRANLQATAALGKPRFWTVAPSVSELLTLSDIFAHRVTGGLLVALGAAALWLRPRQERRAIYLLLLGFALLDLVVWGYSHVGTPIYVDRYLLPFSFAAVLLLCELLTQLREADAPWQGVRTWFPVAFLLAAVLAFMPRFEKQWLPYPDYTAKLLAALPTGIPAVDTDGASFVELEFYRHGSTGHRLLYPLDWPVALDPANVGGVSGPHEMENFKAAGLYAPDIVNTDQVLGLKGEFAVLTDPSALWLRRRVWTNPHLRATHYADFEVDGAPLQVWLVQAP